MMTMDVTKVEPQSGVGVTSSLIGGAGMGSTTTTTTTGSSTQSTPNNPNQLCAGCGKHIQDRFLLRALDLLWHEDCLKCGCCDCRLGEVGSTLYTKGNLMLCKRDYLRLFGNTGFCAACNKVIPAFEMVMRARSNVYHLECFACQQCNHRFCVGDRFYLCENKILCEYDYEERLVFASMANHPMLKRHASSLGGAAGGIPPQNSQSPVGHNMMQGMSPHHHHPGANHQPSHPQNGQIVIAQTQLTAIGHQRQTGDLNNNSNPNNHNSNGLSSPFGNSSITMKPQLGTSS